MRLDLRAASSIASALPSCRVLLLFVGVLLLSESVLLATTMFAASGLSFAASLVLAMKIYRASAGARAARQAAESGDPSMRVRA
jgi:hypothetical protein